MSYPDKCIKGIPNKEALAKTEYGFVASASLFQFNKENQASQLEESINWMDDALVHDFTLAQKKNGKVQFKAGIALLALDHVKAIMRKCGYLDYERRPILNAGDPSLDNPYHGNLLLRADVPPQVKSVIRGVLAFHAEIEIREDYRTELLAS